MIPATAATTEATAETTASVVVKIDFLRDCALSSKYVRPKGRIETDIISLWLAVVS